MSEFEREGWWPAPAKLNLFLHITGRRADGFHLLQTVFQLVELGDRLRFELTDNGQINRLSDLPGVAEEDDIVVRAARLLQTVSGSDHGVGIFVDKSLPMGGGLAGGSTDAATTLVALNRLWDCGMSQQELADLGVQLGADVPVFILGKTAWAEGVGEVLTPIKLPESWYVILHPNISVNTGEIFSAEDLRRDCPPSTIRAFLDSPASNEFVNVCEPVVSKRYPAVAAALADLKAASSGSGCSMTGTGACVFARFETEQQATEALSRLKDKWHGWVTKGVNQSPLLDL